MTIMETRFSSLQGPAEREGKGTRGIPKLVSVIEVHYMNFGTAQLSSSHHVGASGEKRKQVFHTKLSS